MADGAREPPSAGAPGAAERTRLLVGFGIVILFAAGNTVHDLSHGYSARLSLLSSAVILAQCTALTVGYAAARHRGAPRWLILAGGTLLSAGSGVLFLGPHHTERWHGPWTVTAAAGAIVGLAGAGLWLVAFQLPTLFYRARVHALEVENLRREAELSRVRVHLHPHFLLNTLNAIAGLVTEDAAEARRVIAALGDLVRDALEAGDEPRPFAADAAWLRRYAEILEARHRGALAFRWELAEEAMTALVPRLLLQPLVENAIEHGALRRPGGGSVLIRSEAMDGERVRFVVEDDGPGLGPSPAEGLGIGLVRRRLALLHPAGALRFETAAAGTRAVVELPRAREARA